MDTVSTGSAGGDEITDRISTDNAKSFNDLRELLGRLQVVAALERSLFEDILGEKVLPVPAAEIAPAEDK